MNKNVNKMGKYLMIFLVLFFQFRELISLYTISYIKFLPDIFIILFLFFLLLKNKFKMNLKTYDYLYISFIIIGFVSCLINKVSLLAFVLQTRSIGTIYILFYILRNINLSKNDYKDIVDVLCVSNIIVIVMALIEYFFDKEIMFPLVWANSIMYASNFARTYSLMNNPNTFAIFTFVIMFLVYFINKDNLKNRYIIYYILCFLAIILSASRSTMLILVLYFLFLIYVSIKSKNVTNLVYMIGLFIIGFGISYGFECIKNTEYFQKFSTSLIDSVHQNNTQISIDETNNKLENDKTDESEDKIDEVENDKPTENKDENEKINDNKDNNLEDNNGLIENMAIFERWKEIISGKTVDNSSEDGRIFVIKTGIKIFKDNLIFGTGFGTFGSAASRMITPKLYEKYELREGFYADNEYIKIVVETGIVGTIIFGLFILNLLYEILKEKNCYKMFVFMVFLFAGMFYNVFELQVLSLVVYLSLTMMNVSDKHIAKHKDIITL